MIVNLNSFSNVLVEIFLYITVPPESLSVLKVLYLLLCTSVSLIHVLEILF